MANAAPATPVTFNVREFGATGVKNDDARPAIQAAIDACAAAGGGMVYLPPGAYTSGTLHLRSRVRLHLEAGATLYSSKNPEHFDKRALLFAEDAEAITLEGRGTIHGQAEYEWRLHDMQDWYIYPNQLRQQHASQPLLRAFPTANSIGNLVLFIRCADVQIRNLSFLHSPSWTMHLFQIDRLLIDGVYVHTSLKAGVWADGIDPDGCRDVQISNCVIETGDDALVFYSGHSYGPARPCENITVTNCRLSSASSGLKFCDGNEAAIRNVTISNCVISGANRGLAFMVFDGGVLENVLVSNVTVECVRFDWFWWGDADPIHFNCIQRSEIDPNIDKAKEAPVGRIRNITLRDVIARGQGSNLMHGHVDSPLENIVLENVRLTVSHNSVSPIQLIEHALVLENSRNVRMRDVTIEWSDPASDQWRSAFVARNVRGLVLDGLSARQAPGADAPALALEDVTGAVVRNCAAQNGTGLFVHISGARTRNIVLRDNDMLGADVESVISDEVARDAVQH